MTNTIFIITSILLSATSFFLMIRDINNNPIDNISGFQEIVKKKSFVVFCVCMVLFVALANVLFCKLYTENNPLISIKRLMLLSVIWPIAYIDFKTYRIPNSFIIYGLVCRAVVLPFEFIFNSKYIWMSLLADLIATAALLLAAFLCSLCIKNAIGFGDMKLFVVMGLFLGLDGIWSAIFISLILSFIVSAYLLITKKKSRKDAIPFGPALVLGTFISVCISGM